ncbi:MAG: methyltransferase domain-containing protein [Burkholderiaceae bacterium]
MVADSSIRFFDAQFQRQIRAGDLQLNPFEQAALPHLSGSVLDYGCGLGNLALAAARRGCTVLALDASPAAIAHLRAAAAAEGLPLRAVEADLRRHVLHESFDAVVSIGLLMFFDCATALAQLAQLQAHVKPGGIAAINVLVQGTTYLEMFDTAGHCLFAPDELTRCFAGWQLLRCERQDFEAPGGTVKSFVTVVARKPAGEATTTS